MAILPNARPDGEGRPEFIVYHVSAHRDECVLAAYVRCSDGFLCEGGVCIPHTGKNAPQYKVGLGRELSKRRKMRAQAPRWNLFQSRTNARMS